MRHALSKKSRSVEEFHKLNLTDHYEKLYRIASFRLEHTQAYQSWLLKNYPDNEVLAKQTELAQKLKKQPLFSVIIPIYKTPPDLLKECIESVIAQSYSNWELCLVDDHSESAEIKKLCEAYVKKYPKKINYRYRKQNGHISVSSNEAVDISKGEYLVLVDHDDIIWPNALFEVALAINKKPGVDLVYTDEDKINSYSLHDHPFLKPAFNKGYIESCNYITHLSVIKKETFEKIGGFRQGVEGAQDWDLFLRICAITDNVIHIPKITYSWRMIETSTAMGGFTAKPYAHDAQKKAILDYFASKNVPAKNAILNSGYIGWLLQYEQASIQAKLAVNMQNCTIEQSITLITRIQQSLYTGLEITYFINLNKKDLKRVTKRFDGQINLINDKEFDEKIDQFNVVLLADDINDLKAADGWLADAIGSIVCRDYDAVAPALRYANHIVISAGRVSTGAKVLPLLHQYVPDTDTRLDTALFASRDVDLPDPRVFLCKASKYYNLRSSRPKPTRTLFTPFADFYVDDTRTEEDHYSEVFYKPLKFSGNPNKWFSDYVI